MTSEDAGRVDDAQPDPAEETVEETETAPAEEADVEDSAAEEDPLAAAQAAIADLEDQLARSRADLYNVSQEYNAYVRRSKADGAAQKQAGIVAVLETLLSVLDDIELARQHDDLNGPAGAIATKVENTLQTNYQLVRFGAVGEPFDPEIHEALMNTPSDVESEQIGTLIQPGYKMGDRVLRPARVGVVSPQ
ncbi:nucleotide exchange factor GrpE [Flaviflexus sp. JY899]|uniref:Protein GrpE n=2 Tax=Flaviflexus equikiangi TaxID=2758573 RepID=A0ABS2TH51_9ACTO|nr:nucleotide exchange factor GrpE [Flaviflexus equikiangi]MBM9433985.1 nucleotide exchange factor GrpE [Flaviflexus equikiangi]